MDQVEGNEYCFLPARVTTAGLWGRETDILDYMLPVFTLQLLAVIFLARAVAFLLKPLRQPKVIAETIAGVLLGPSILGSWFNGFYNLFPAQSFVILDTAASIALTYYMFMVAVELDVHTIWTMGKKVLTIAVFGMVFSFVVSFTSASLFKLQADIVEVDPRFHVLKDREEKSNLPFLLFLSLAVSVTGLPVVARIITELKLLNSPLGPLSLGSAVLNETFAWFLLALLLAHTGGKDGKTVSPHAPLWFTLTGTAFVLVCFYVVRPSIKWMSRRTPEGGRINNFHLGIILAGVPAAGFLSDLIGTHSMFGSFIYGLAVPNGPLTTHLIERMEPFVENMLLPLFFANNGYRININIVLPSWATIAFAGVVVLSTFAKVGSTVIVAMLNSMSFRDGLAIGALMSVKGPVEMIILNIALDKEALSGDPYTVIVLTSLATTALVVPVVMLSHIKPTKPLAAYRRRNIQGARSDAELRMLACIHSTRHVHSLTRLLDVSNHSKRSPILVYVLHLVEVAGRVSSMLIMHSSGGSSHYGDRRRPALPYGQAQSESILAAIEGYEQHSAGVSFQPLTAFSQSATMHEDVCNIAEERHASLIVLPFHKHMTIDGAMEEDSSAAVRPVNLNVLANAPCSVAILVDRGLGSGPSGHFPGAHHPSHHVALVFIGGPDDREALAYACRMAEHKAMVVSVIRFIDAAPLSRLQSTSSVDDEETASSLLAAAELDKKQDDEAVNEFRLRFVSNESVVFTEKVSTNGGETVAALREMGSSYDLYVLGRGHGRKSALTEGLEEWSEFHELGLIGDLLASSDFGAKVSVLVVQQYKERELAEVEREALGGNGPLSQPEVQRYVNNANRQQLPSTFNAGWTGA